MDRVKTMVYPGSPAETVTYTYLPSKGVGTVVGNSTYVGWAQYTPWGALDLLELGTHASPVLRVDYGYYAWNGANGEGRGRLSQILTGTPADTDSLQDLRYSDYDLVGNVKQIQDYKAGSPQTQSFTYDELNRLSTAQASGGSNGTYGPESYTYSTIGNITAKAGTTYGYNDAAHKHAVTHLNGVQKYAYDANGNQTTRAAGGSGYTLGYDAENHLTSVSGLATASFVYGPGGERVKGVVGATTTYYIGNYYEVQGATVRKYYYAGSQRVAMREGTTLYWLLSDHLGSQAITANGTSGAWVGEVRYKAWGEDRAACASPPCGTTPTTYRYTGQRVESGIGLYYYGARWYDASLSRFTQPDTIVPGPDNPQSLNRYSYALNCPLRYKDPSGHRQETEWEASDGGRTEDYVPRTIYRPKMNTTYLGQVESFPRGDYGIQGIILHKTSQAADTMEGVMSWFQYRHTGANYVVGSDGTIYQLAPDSLGVHHAGGEYEGASSWKPAEEGREPITDWHVSQATIGIEVMGQTGAELNDAQKKSLTVLVVYLATTYNIDPRNIVGHADITKGNSDGREFLPEASQAVASAWENLPNHGNPRHDW